MISFDGLHPKQQREIRNFYLAERERRLNGTVAEWWSVVRPEMIRRLERHLYLFSRGKIDINGLPNQST